MASFVYQRERGLRRAAHWHLLRIPLAGLTARADALARRRAEKSARRLRWAWAVALSTVVSLGLVLAVGLGFASHLLAQARLPEDLLGDRGGVRSSFIYDREGNLLYELYSDKRRYYTDLDHVSPVLIEAVLAAEDARFYEHEGVDPQAIARSALINLQRDQVATGASTISQQVIKYLYFTERGEQLPEVSLERKVEEANRAIQLEREYSKNEILEYYLNTLFLGNGVWGVETAAQVFFDKPAAELSLAESSVIAGIIAEPSRANPYSEVRVTSEDPLVVRLYAQDDPQGRVPLYRVRQLYVLRQMQAGGKISARQLEQALAEPLPLQPLTQQLNAPHFVWYVERTMIERYGVAALRQGGLQITTTLDPHLQSAAEQLTREHVAANRVRHGMTNAALLSTDPRSGQILAYVGGQDYYDDSIDGKVDVLTSRRQPGSTIKPLVYLQAIERGYSPSTYVLDSQTQFGAGAGAYIPRNYDYRFHGYVTLRQALANSYNVPAVKLMNLLGVEPTVERVRALGLTGLAAPAQYGLAFALGAAEATPLEMATAFGVLANQGVQQTPEPILRITDDQGRILIDNSERVGLPVLDPGVAYIMGDMLSDNQARIPAFGRGNVLELSRRAAVKTGTTSSVRDNWTIGYVPQLLTVVWAGNNDGTPLRNASGVTGAAPLWHAFMEEAFGLLQLEATWYTQPLDVSVGSDLQLNDRPVLTSTIQ